MCSSDLGCRVTAKSLTEICRVKELASPERKVLVTAKSLMEICRVKVWDDPEDKAASAVWGLEVPVSRAPFIKAFT